jgi:hypothetical protein
VATLPLASNARAAGSDVRVGIRLAYKVHFERPRTSTPAAGQLSRLS